MTPARAVALMPSPAPVSRLSRVGELLLDGLLAFGMVLTIPLVIILVGVPVAFAVRLVLWLVERL